VGRWPVTKRMRCVSSCGGPASGGGDAWCMSQDRGYASGPWLGALRGFDCRFILCWKLNYHMVTEVGVKQATWKIPRGKVGLAPRTIWDAVHHCNVQGSVLFFPIPHPDFPDWPLTLVVGRRKGANSWYLVTTYRSERFIGRLTYLAYNPQSKFVNRNVRLSYIWTIEEVGTGGHIAIPKMAG
jgi:hypothetical protein